MDSRTAAPDLASVLKTLSSFVPPDINELATQHPAQSSRDDDYDPLHFAPLDTFQAGSSVPTQIQNEPHTQQSFQSFPSRETLSLPDPSTITAWPAALRFVMKTVAQSESLQFRIRRLIRSQHEHERKWWEAREAMIAKQASRAEKQQKLDEVLYVGSPLGQYQESIG